MERETSTEHQPKHASENAKRILRKYMLVMLEVDGPVSETDFLAMVDEVHTGNTDLAERIGMSWESAWHILNSTDELEAGIERMMRQDVVQRTEEGLVLTESGHSMAIGIRALGY